MVFDGKKFAFEIEAKLKAQVDDLKKKGITPRLLAILVGDNPGSVLYLKLKAKFAQGIGVAFELQQFPEYAKAEEIIQFLNSNLSHVGGVTVQLPLPNSLEESKKKILNAIDPKKDIDGLTTTSFELLKKGEKCFLPAVVRAVIEVMNFYDLWPREKVAAVVGAKGWVGERMFWALKNRGLKKVLVIDLETEKKLSDLKTADLIVSCVGKPKLISADLIKEGAIVFDLGVMVVEGDGQRRTVGDVDFEKVSSKASFITPVPGGIGPVTVACLFENLIENTIV